MASVNVPAASVIKGRPPYRDLRAATSAHAEITDLKPEFITILLN